MTKSSAANDVLDVLATILPGSTSGKSDPSPGYVFDTNGIAVWAGCPHLAENKPIPRGVAFATLREPFVAFCVACAMPRLIKEQSDPNCDVCLQPATEFSEFQLSMGRYIAAGNVCTSCRDGGWPRIEEHLRVKAAEVRVAMAAQPRIGWVAPEKSKESR